MIEAITLLLLCQLAGEGLARGLALPVPGPVIGLMFLLIGLLARDRIKPEAPPVKDQPIGILCTFLLAHLSLLFVPAGVGILGQLDVLARHGTGLMLALVVSTALSMIVTASVFVIVSRSLARKGDAP